MNNKLKLVVEFDNHHQMEELVQLVTKQVAHNWSQWDKKSTDDEKILMDVLSKNPKMSPAEIESYFSNNESRMAWFMLRVKDYYWQYVNSLERLKELQKAYDKFNYNTTEPFDEFTYGLHWSNE